MSFSIPKNVPNFKDPYRNLEDKAWAAVRGGASYFDNQELPMYKDKPQFASSRRRKPFWKRKRIVLLTVITVCFLWLRGWLPGSRKTGTKPSGWSWLSGAGGVNWDHRREQVVEAFQVTWDSYERYGWGHDEYHPISKTGRNMAPQGLGWIIVDALDTMILMNQTRRLTQARKWLATSLTWEQDQDVNTFETTIRMLGGLLSAHYLSSTFPSMAPLEDDDPGQPGEDLYIELATDLAGRLMVAFDSPSGIPYSSVNLERFTGIPSHADMGASSTAEATTLQLEFKYLAKLTGEKNYWDKVEKIMEIIDDNNAKDGLVPIFIYPNNGEYRGDNIRLGSRGDSYYEYLIKQYLQTNKKETIYETMWNEALQGVRKHLLTYTEPSGFTIVGERPNGLEAALSPKMDHLVCFLPGTIALAATGGLPLKEARKLPNWSRQHEEDMRLAAELTQTCWGMYKYMATGLSAEITYFNIADPPAPPNSRHNPPSTFDPNPDATWRKDFDVHGNDVHNLQRPETVESLFYMWRITGDVKYREWGWEMFESFRNHTAVDEQGGFTSLSNANVIPPLPSDNLESFWMAETLKYFYLLFSPNDLLPLDQIVFNTEAHPFPRFDMGPLFSTGWQRKPRDADGNVIGAAIRNVKIKVEESVVDAVAESVEAAET